MTINNDETEDGSSLVDNSANQELIEFLEYFQNKVPNPENYPAAFEFYVKMYKFHKGYNE